MSQLKKAYKAREELKAKIKLQLEKREELEKVEDKQQAVLVKALETRDEKQQVLAEIDNLLEEATTRSVDVSREIRQREDKIQSIERSKRK